MVNNVTSLTGNGLKDWLIQRVTAVYFAAYSLFIIGYLLLHPQLDFAQWHNLFSSIIVQVATMIAFFALLLHSWIGIWTVTTDYMKCTVLRLSVQMIVALWLLSQFIWGLMILWGR
ncbi:MAG: succinate dehydrogenase, hydrophobic membrane anchor protein [Legionella longbeachae]|nr:succinate dehydrogenase, hydrophobic membrane anchor protein [Legionella longbeachae]